METFAQKYFQKLEEEEIIYKTNGISFYRLFLFT